MLKEDSLQVHNNQILSNIKDIEKSKITIPDIAESKELASKQDLMKEFYCLITRNDIKEDQDIIKYTKGTKFRTDLQKGYAIFKKIYLLNFLLQKKE